MKKQHLGRPSVGGRVKLLFAALLGSVLALNWTPAAQSAPTPVHPVTELGQTEYNYEALIYHLFGPSARVCQDIVAKVNGFPTTKHNWLINPNRFPKQDPAIAPNVCPPFSYTFTNFGKSNFHLEPDWFAISSSRSWIIFHQRAGAVQINGRYVACEPQGTSVLGVLPNLPVGSGGLYAPFLECFRLS